MYPFESLDIKKEKVKKNLVKAVRSFIHYPPMTRVISNQL